jgi:CMP-N-acetylneuraminic acid synthetase
MIIYAIIPARSGSKGIPNKNIRKIADKELIGYSIDFARSLDVDKVICSTDSEYYAEIARKYGAEVPFLRSAFAAQDTSMEEHILEDLYDKFDSLDLSYPDIFVWLRPTFVFRDRLKVLECIEKLARDLSLTACRIIVEAESRLYNINDDRIVASFDDKGKSMIRRQDVKKGYKVYSTDIFRGNPKNATPQFLGAKVGYVIADKICGLDIDDEIDLDIVSYLVEHRRSLVDAYLP